MSPTAQTNGQPIDPAAAVAAEDVKGALLTTLTPGYRPTLPMWAIEAEWMPQIYLLRDIELMLTHPQVRNALSYYRSAIYNAEFEINCSDPTAQQFIEGQIRRYWE